MRKLSILLFVVVASLSAYAINEEKETTKESGSYSFQPKPLDDEWSRWLVGKWKGVSGQSDFLGGELEGLGESDNKVTVEYTVELGLNGQFLICESRVNTSGMTDEQKKQIKEALKEKTNASDEDVERYLSTPYKALEIYTIDQKTGDVIGYLFESPRCIAEGRGRRRGNKEIVEWKWSGGIAQGTTSESITEKVNNDKFTITHKYVLPNGEKMEEKMEFARKKTQTESHI